MQAFCLLLKTILITNLSIDSQLHWKNFSRFSDMFSAASQFIKGYERKSSANETSLLFG